MVIDNLKKNLYNKIIIGAMLLDIHIQGGSNVTFSSDKIT